MVALPALVSGLDAELVRLGYKDSTMAWYRGCWRRMEKYFAARGMRGVLAGRGDGVGRPGLRRLLRQGAGRHPEAESHVYGSGSPQMLGEYAVHGAVLRRYNRSVCKLAGDGAEAVARFQAHLRAAGSRRIDGADVRDAGRGVRRVHRHARRAGLL